MIKLQSLLLVGLCTLVCFIQAMENNQIEMNKNLLSKEDNKEENPLDTYIDISDPNLEEIKKLIKHHDITNVKIIDKAANYFMSKISDTNAKLTFQMLVDLFDMTSEQLGAPNHINVNDLIQKRELTKVFYPTPPRETEAKDTDVNAKKEEFKNYLKIKLMSKKNKQNAPIFEHTCEYCSATKFVYLLGDADANMKAMCLDCAISDLTFDDLLKQEYVELVVIYLLTQHGDQQKRFQDSTITPQLISDILMLTSSAINLAWDVGSDFAYSGEYVHTWHAYHLLMTVYFSVQFVGTALFALSMYSKRLCQGDFPILVFGKWHGAQTFQAIMGAISVTTVAGYRNFRAGDAINGIMLGLSALNIWTSQNIGLYEQRYIAWNENYLTLATRKGFTNKQDVLNKLSWRDNKGILVKQFGSILVKGFCCANGFIACSLIPHYTGAGEAFNMPSPFIHAGLVGNVMIWGSWFFLTIGSFFMPEMAWDSSLSFSYKLLQIGISFGIMLCTASFNHQTKLYINFGSFMIPLMLFVGNEFYLAFNRWNSKETKIPTMPRKLKYSQLKFNCASKKINSSKEVDQIELFENDKINSLEEVVKFDLSKDDKNRILQEEETRKQKEEGIRLKQEEEKQKRKDDLKLKEEEEELKRKHELRLKQDQEELKRQNDLKLQEEEELKRKHELRLKQEQEELKRQNDLKLKQEEETRKQKEEELRLKQEEDEQKRKEEQEIKSSEVENITFSDEKTPDKL